MYRIKIDRSLCIGCLTCVTACAVAHQSGSDDTRNRVVMDSNLRPSPIFCRQCSRPECAYTCMTGAMKRNHETGYVEYDASRCASCYMCVMACPYGVLKSDSHRHVEILKCNMCVHLTDDPKGDPYCVRKCPTRAITFEEVEE